MVSVAEPVRGKRQRLDYLDALRGAAALLVVFFHYILGSPEANFGASGRKLIVILSDYMDLGRIGVVLFFAISGFIIPTSLLAPAIAPVRKFIVGRFFRLYPVYWVSIFLCVALGTGSQPSLFDVAANITMVQSFLRAPEINGAAWTLAIELVFYAICLGLFLAGLVRRRAVQFAMFLAMLVGALALAYLRQHLARKLPVALPMALAVMFFGSLWRGVILDRDPDARRYATYAIACLALAIPVICWTAYTVDYGFHEWPLPYFISYNAGLIAFLVGTTQLRHCPTFVTHMGTISYSIYLLHTPVMSLAAQLGFVPTPQGTPLENWAIIFALIGAVIAISHWSYVLVEKPSIALGRHFGTPRTRRGISQSETPT